MAQVRDAPAKPEPAGLQEKQAHRMQLLAEELAACSPSIALQTLLLNQQVQQQQQQHLLQQQQPAEGHTSPTACVDPQPAQDEKVSDDQAHDVRGEDSEVTAFNEDADDSPPLPISSPRPNGCSTSNSPEPDGPGRSPKALVHQQSMAVTRLAKIANKANAEQREPSVGDRREGDRQEENGNPAPAPSTHPEPTQGAAPNLPGSAPHCSGVLPGSQSLQAVLGDTPMHAASSDADDVIAALMDLGNGEPAGPSGGTHPAAPTVHGSSCGPEIAPQEPHPTSHGRKQDKKHAASKRVAAVAHADGASGVEHSQKHDKLTQLAIVAGDRECTQSSTHSPTHSPPHSLPKPQSKSGTRTRRVRRPSAKKQEAIQDHQTAPALNLPGTDAQAPSSDSPEVGPHADGDAMEVESPRPTSPTHSKQTSRSGMPSQSGQPIRGDPVPQGKAKSGTTRNGKRKLDDDEISQQDSAVSHADFYPAGASMGNQRKWVEVSQIQDTGSPPSHTPSPPPCGDPHMPGGSAIRSPTGKPDGHQQAHDIAAVAVAQPLARTPQAPQIKRLHAADDRMGIPPPGSTENGVQYIWMSEDHPVCRCSKPEQGGANSDPDPRVSDSNPVDGQPCASGHEQGAGQDSGQNQVHFRHWMGLTQLEGMMLAGQMPLPRQLQAWEEAAWRTLQLTSCIRQFWQASSAPQQQVPTLH